MVIVGTVFCFVGARAGDLQCFVVIWSANSLPRHFPLSKSLQQRGTITENMPLNVFFFSEHGNGAHCLSGGGSTIALTNQRANRNFGFQDNIYWTATFQFCAHQAKPHSATYES